MATIQSNEEKPLSPSRFDSIIRDRLKQGVKDKKYPIWLSKLNASNHLKTEEDLRIRIEHILRDEILDKLEIPWAQYEHRTQKITSIGKAGKPSDVLYGRVVIEYESPKAFGNTLGKKNSRYNHALSQITRDYIPDLAKRNVHEYARYYGIVLDGSQIGFVRYRDKWIDEGP